MKLPGKYNRVMGVCRETTTSPIKLASTNAINTKEQKFLKLQYSLDDSGPLGGHLIG